MTLLQHDNNDGAMAGMVPVVSRNLLFCAIACLMVCLLAPAVLPGQTIIKRHVVASGGGSASGAAHGVRGTISQTSAGRMVHDGGQPHDLGFWYWAYRPTVTTVVSIPRIDAEIGTRITLPVTLSTSPGPTPFTPRPFHARIRFNHTLLHPAGATGACTADTGDCVIQLDGIAQSDNGVIANLEFVVALGDSEATAVTIDEFVWEKKGEERIATTREHGEVRLLGVCRSGGQVRLITTAGSFASRVRLSPNPAHGSTVLEYVASEDGPVSVRLVDLLGNDVVRLVETSAEAARLYRVDADLSGIASGTYMVVYSTPTQIITERLVIAR